MSAPSLRDVTTYLDRLLPPSGFPHDSSWNGLQVDAGRAGPVSLVAVAVDAGESVIGAAAAAGADLLVVHHGLFWGRGTAVTDAAGRKIRRCVESGLSVYASHLPLDAHPVLGNNSLLLAALGARPDGRFGGPDALGARGVFDPHLGRDEAIAAVAAAVGAAPLVLPFGPERIATVGVVTGAAADMIPDATAAGLDLFVSGEPKHQAYHAAKEAGMNAIFAGHYLTEVFGVKKVGEELGSRFGVGHLFLDEPTGI